MDFKQHHANAVKLLQYLEQIKTDETLVPPDGTVQGTLEIAVAKVLNTAFNKGFESCMCKVQNALSKINS